jgi:Flp pilus assembly protein TadG
MIRLRLPRAARDRRGASAVEFSLVAIPLLILMFGVIEMGRAMWTREALQETAIAGARCMGVSNSNCAAGGVYSASATTSYVEHVAQGWGLAIPDAGVTLNPNATCAGANGFSQVTVVYTFQVVAPGLLGPLATGTVLSATACFPNNS